jgi:hypothetical protein
MKNVEIGFDDLKGNYPNAFLQIKKIINEQQLYEILIDLRRFIHHLDFELQVCGCVGKVF